MFNPVTWFYRHLRQVRLACILCLIVTYSTLLFGGIPILSYFDQLQAQDALPESKTATTFNDSVTTAANHGTTTLNPWNISKYPPMFADWQQNLFNVCDGRMELYARQFARLRNVIVDRTFCVARAHGGEEVDRVLFQDENAEYYIKIRHCFQLECKDVKSFFTYHFSGINFLDDWLYNLKTANVQTSDVTLDPNFNIALMRREYANLYHTINDWYNIFLLMVFFKKRPDETNIVLVDAHPKGKLDPVWSVLFNSTRMLSELDPRTLFTTMVWGMQGYNSVLKEPFQVYQSPLLLEEFRMFFLDRFQLNATRQLNCEKVSVLFIWRHDYLAHPRNPSGLVQRKIDNEEELLVALRGRHPNYSIRGVQIDAFDMRDQLRLVTQADILIGMHGAGLSHTLFVPPHGGTIELVPKYYGSENNHFVDLARHRGLAHTRWVNNNYAIEMNNYRTRIPIDTIDGLLKKVVVQMCTESQQTRLERNRPLRQPDRQGGNAELKGRNRMEVDVGRWDARPVVEGPHRRLLPRRAVERERYRARRL